MDQALLIGAAVFFGLVAITLWSNKLRGSQKAKSNTREVGYLRPEIQIDAAAVPEFKPTWQELGDKNQAG